MRSFSKAFFILLVFSSLCFGRVVYQTNSFLDTQALGHLQYRTNLSGGSGGVDVYELGGKRYTLKASQETDHINEEIMADGLYKSLGVPVPSFMVLDSLEGFSNFRPSQEKWPKGPYRIAEFIEGHMLTKEQLDKEVKSSFVADAFLANRDIAAGIERNVIIRDNIAYRIDNGGSLRFRSKGERKGGAEDPWDSSLIPELKTLLVHGAMVYQGLSEADVQKQIQGILKRTPQFLQTFQKISRALKLSEQSQTELEHMLIGRLRTLTVLANPENTYVASRNRYTSPFTAAGAFILSTHEGKLYALLGQRNSSQPHVHDTWCTLGGKADYGIDQDLATAASREIYEESDKKINIPDTELRITSSHDLVRPDHLFRQYIITIPYVDVAGIHYHEYLNYKWVPVENLLSRKTLETGVIEGTSDRLFEPFWDMIKTEQVQYLLKGYVLNRPQTRELHTQSTVQNPHLPVNRKINKFPPELSSTQFEKEHQLGHAIINKSILLRDIKKKFPKESVDELHYVSNEDSSSSYRYTASEGQLKIYLGDQYTPVTSLETLRSLKKNIDTALQKSAQKVGLSIPTRLPALLRDKFFRSQLLTVLMKERAYDPRFMVLYHGCEGNIGFLFDIFTELRQLVSGQFQRDSQIFRGIDESFKDIDNIFTFQRKFGIDPESRAKSSFEGNYKGNYQDLAISTNFFLFGNPEDPTSCSFSLFFDSASLRPIDIGKFLSYLEIAFGGLRLDKDRYTRLYESIIKEPTNLDGRLYQIFINPNYINTLVYGSLSQGYPYYFNYSRLRDLLRTEKVATEFPDVTESVTHSCTPHMYPPKISLGTTSTAPKGFFEVLKENPDLFGTAVSDAQRHVDRGTTGASILQARLLLSPECFHNPQIVQTFLYHRTEKAQENHEKFLEKLREYLREDLSVWLHKKEQLESGVSTHAEIPTAARTRYSELYKKNFGKQYVPQGVPFNKTLAKVESLKDTSLLEDLIRKHGLEKVLLTPIISADSYKEGFSTLGGRSALLYQDWVFKYLEEILNDPSKSPSEREKLENFLKSPPQEEIFFGKILEKLYISHDVKHLDGLIKKYGFQKVFFTASSTLSRGGKTRLTCPPLVDQDWFRTYLEEIMSDDSPESLLKREYFGELLIHPLMIEIAQLKDWEHFKDIRIPDYLIMMKFYVSAKDVFASLVEKRILEHSLSPKEIFDILQGVLFTRSDLREFLQLNPSYWTGKTFMNKLIRNFLDQESIHFNKKQEFLKKLLDLPKMKEEKFKEVIYSSILQSSLSEKEKKECEPWERLYADDPNKRDFIESIYGLGFDLKNPLEKYTLIERLAPIWGPYASEATGYAIVVCLDRFTSLKSNEASSQKKKYEDISLTTENINQLTHFLESLLPIIQVHYDKKVPSYQELEWPIRHITRNFIPNSLKEFSQDPVRVKALEHLQALLSFIDIKRR